MVIVQIEQELTITIPNEICRKLKLKDWDIFDMKIINWSIILEKLFTSQNQEDKNTKIDII